MTTFGCQDVTLDDEELMLLNEVLTQRFGLHFPEHKRDILASRLRPRLAARHLRSFFDYYLAVRYDRNGELERFAQAVTNHETYFFREAHQFEGLVRQGLDFLDLPPGRRLRILSAGCSSGEEPYTLNIHLKENAAILGRGGHPLEATIDAFDLDQRRIEMARRGIYGAYALRGIEPRETRLYFRVREEEEFDLRSPYRQGVRFQTGNIMSLDSYPTRGPYDVVFCRNVFIYFTEATMLAALENFARVLRPGGLLFLGHSESAIGLSPAFESVRLNRCLAYQKVAD